jgi:cobalt-zinc-cadmium efflux system membrane fusion protein
VSLFCGAIAISIGGFALRRGGAAPVVESLPDVLRTDGSAIVFSKAFRERAGVQTTTVKRGPLAPLIKVAGDVTYDPEHVAAVGTRIPGLVRKLERFEGDSVESGDVLAEVESAELGEAQASVAMIDAQRRAAELNAVRERDLVVRKLSTAREAEVAEATLSEHRAMLEAARQKATALGGTSRAALGVHLLRAPLAGTVVERHVSAGQSVEGHLVAFRVANLDHLWIELSVYEKNLGAIHRGDPVAIEPLSDPGRVIQGSVAYVGDAIDERTRSASVRVEVDNRERNLRPGQSVTAKIRASRTVASALLVPLSSVTFVDGKPVVFVAQSDERVVPTSVVLGAADGTMQEIVEGLTEGATVVHEGVFALKSELFR